MRSRHGRGCALALFLTVSRALNSPKTILRTPILARWTRAYASTRSFEGGDLARKSTKLEKKLVVVGGGAAGFMAAIEAARASKDGSLSVCILEATSKVLSKVKISGGGRCNVMHDDRKDIREITEGYPRGKKPLIGLLNRFGPAQTRKWFNTEGVRLKTEKDGRMFPISDSSQTIIDALTNAARQHNIQIRTGTKVESIEQDEKGKFHVECKISSRNSPSQDTVNPVMCCDYVILSPGSYRPAYEWARRLGHPIEAPVPSLFTFDTKRTPSLLGLAGVSVQDAVATLSVSQCADDVKREGGKAKVKRSKFVQRGPILITHKGLSGPAILRLSAFAARELHHTRYTGDLTINWVAETGISSVEEARRALEAARDSNRAKQVSTFCPLGLPKRLWGVLVAESGAEDKKWSEMSKKELNKLTDLLLSHKIPVTGKGAYKDEFVTCGGVSLKSLNPKTMQSKHVPGLFFAGEILDVDGITGGYNFQSAWSTGWHAGHTVGDMSSVEED